MTVIGYNGGTMKKSNWSCELLALTLMVYASVVVAQGSGSWDVIHPTAYDRAEIAVAEVNGKIYVMTGQSPGV
jgi:hypothetical protein